jgi:glycosyltransferase involved in cell wall biosynthesis
MPDKVVILHLRHSEGAGGGPETGISNSASFIDSDKFSPIVVYLRKPKEDISPISDRLRQRKINYFEFPGMRFFSLNQFLNIVKLIRRYQVHIIHCHDPKTDFYGYLLKFLFPKLIFISTIHGWIERSYKGTFYNRLDRYVLRSFTVVIAVSQNIEQVARKHRITNTHLIHNAIDINKWQPMKQDCSSEGLTKDSRPFSIGFVGRISKEKGPIDFVRIAHKVLGYAADCKFIIAGEGPEKESMEIMVKELRMEDKLHFLGQLDRGQLHALYQKLDLLLLTSSTEGLPRAILEACAMSVPVVATRVGGVEEIITHNYNGLLAEAGDIDLMTKHVLFVKDNPELADKFKKNGRTIVENKFSLKERVKSIENLYHETMFV